METRRLVGIARATFEQWLSQLEGVHGLPVLVLAVGQDHNRGQLGAIPAPWAPPPKELARILRWAADQFDPPAGEVVEAAGPWLQRPPGGVQT